MKDPLIIITGPTAVGKSALAVEMAKDIGGEIISADSMQIYRGMDIGTAKITKTEMQGIRHYLIDILDPWEPWNVTMFQQYAASTVHEIREKGKIPIVTGGTGFYIQALRYGIHFTDQAVDENYRQEAEQYALEHGNTALHDKLWKVDPEAAAAIPVNNVKRTVRALEYYHTTGQKISVHNASERKREPVYNDVCFVIDDDRQKLYARIDDRVDQMMQEGLLEEVRQLREAGCMPDMVSMQAIGYKQILAYLDGQYSLEEAVRLIKRDSRHYAKRQLTWFRRARDITWIERQAYHEDMKEMLEAMKEECRKRGIIA